MSRSAVAVRRGFAVVAAAITALAVATPANAASVPSEAKLKAALLTAKDVPGLSVVPDTSADGGSADVDTSDVTSPIAGCDNKLKALDSLSDAKSDVERTFVAKGGLQSNIEEISAFSSAATLAKDLKTIQSVFLRCNKIVMEDPSFGTVSLAVSRLTVPKLGDQTIGFRWVGSVQGVRMVFEFCYSRHGRVLITSTVVSAKSADSAGNITFFKAANAKVVKAGLK